MSRLDDALETFEKNVQAVLQLSDLDRGLIDHAIREIEKRDERLRQAGVENTRMLAGGTLENLKNIRRNDSLRPGFQALVNQSIVLLSSYFSSGVSQLFREAIAAGLEAGPSDHMTNLQLKISVGDLAQFGADVYDAIPDLIAESPGISFQDTKSIARAFEEFFAHVIPRDETTNEITTGLALRHVLVHNGGVVNRQCLRQTSSAKPRKLRPELRLGQALELSSAEIGLLAQAMMVYLKELAAGLGPEDDSIIRESASSGR